LYHLPPVRRRALPMRNGGRRSPREKRRGGQGKRDFLACFAFAISVLFDRPFYCPQLRTARPLHPAEAVFARPTPPSLVRVCGLLASHSLLALSTCNQLQNVLLHCIRARASSLTPSLPLRRQLTLHRPTPALESIRSLALRATTGASWARSVSAPLSARRVTRAAGAKRADLFVADESADGESCRTGPRSPNFSYDENKPYAEVRTPSPCDTSEG
jgi:hypothetical protein